LELLPDYEDEDIIFGFIDYADPVSFVETDGLAIENDRFPNIYDDFNFLD
jgi:hypothetical protein